MNTSTKDPGITFQVAQVDRAKNLLPTKKAPDVIAEFLSKVNHRESTKIEACSAFNANCVECMPCHALFFATHIAFSEHRPLVLSPDIFWVTIVQGIAQHIRNNAESLRHLFVSHEGRETIQVTAEILEGTPENAWDEVILKFGETVRQRTKGDRYEQLVSNFSTTGPAERVACEAALLDAFEPFFQYAVFCICGIPEITLQGTVQDWQTINQKLDAVSDLGLDWWLPHVREIINKCIDTVSGDIDNTFWQDIYKRQQAYGGDVINGWLLKLVPYLQVRGSSSVRNPLLTDAGAKISSDSLPPGLSQVPFKLVCRQSIRNMEFLGGFIGIEQDEATMALKPKLGWAVRESNGAHTLFSETFGESLDRPLDQSAYTGQAEKLFDQLGFSGQIPSSILSFYKFCNGGTYKSPNTGLTYRFLQFKDTHTVIVPEPKEQPEPRSLLEKIGLRKRAERFQIERTWLKLADVSDGSFIAHELSIYEPRTALVHPDGQIEMYKRPLPEFLTEL